MGAFGWYAATMTAREETGNPRNGAAERPGADALRDSAPRRTFLAAERTYLAWLRTGLGALGLALGVGRLLPALLEVPVLPFTILGAGYGAYGLFLLLYSLVRWRAVVAALKAGRPLPSDLWGILVTSVAGVALAIATIVMVVAIG
jgi:putative membrane protein